MTTTTPRAHHLHRAKLLVSVVVQVGVVIGIYLVVHLAGIGVEVIRTSSMVPTLRPKDAVVTVSPKVRTPHVGDIVVFTPRYGDDALPQVAHRVTSITDGRISTRGDAASAQPDGWDASDIQGVVVARIPFHLVTHPGVVAALSGLVVLGMIWPQRRSTAVPVEAGNTSTIVYLELGPGPSRPKALGPGEVHLELTQ